MLTPVIREITQERINYYAEASGDDNPLHVDEEFAANSIFGSTVAHGMLVLALVSEMMQTAFPREWASGGSLKIRFKRPTFPGDTVTANGELLSENSSGTTFAVSCVNQKGEVLLEGKAVVRKQRDI